MPDAGALRTAFQGKIASRVPSEGSREQLLKTYLPIRLAGDKRPRNVLELQLPCAPVQSTIERRTKSLDVGLALGALLLYLALLPSVLRASAALAELLMSAASRELRRSSAAASSANKAAWNTAAACRHADETSARGSFRPRPRAC